MTIIDADDPFFRDYTPDEREVQAQSIILFLKTKGFMRRLQPEREQMLMWELAYFLEYSKEGSASPTEQIKILEQQRNCLLKRADELYFKIWDVKENAKENA